MISLVVVVVVVLIGDWKYSMPVEDKTSEEGTA